MPANACIMATTSPKPFECQLKWKTAIVALLLDHTTTKRAPAVVEADSDHETKTTAVASVPPATIMYATCGIWRAPTDEEKEVGRPLQIGVSSTVVFVALDHLAMEAEEEGPTHVLLIVTATTLAAIRMVQQILRWAPTSSGIKHTSPWRLQCGTRHVVVRAAAQCNDGREPIPTSAMAIVDIQPIPSKPLDLGCSLVLFLIADFVNPPTQ
jgi:phosphatidylserine synthase